MKYFVVILLMLSSSSYILGNDIFGLLGQIAGIAGQAAFDPIIRNLGVSLGNLTARELDMLKSKGIEVWPHGATPEEIKELQKQGYTPSFSWPAPGTRFAYSPTGWIDYWRENKKPLHVRERMEKADAEILGDFLTVLTSTKTSHPTPLQAAEILRTKYTPIVIKIAEKINKANFLSRSVISMNDIKKINDWWALVNKMKPIKEELEKIVKKDPNLYKRYSFIPTFNKLTSRPNINAANEIAGWIWHPENKKIIYGPPPA